MKKTEEESDEEEDDSEEDTEKKKEEEKEESKSDSLTEVPPFDFEARGLNPKEILLQAPGLFSFLRPPCPDVCRCCKKDPEDGASYLCWNCRASLRENYGLLIDAALKSMSRLEEVCWCALCGTPCFEEDSMCEDPYDLNEATRLCAACRCGRKHAADPPEELSAYETVTGIEEVVVERSRHGRPTRWSYRVTRSRVLAPLKGRGNCFGPFGSLKDYQRDLDALPFWLTTCQSCGRRRPPSALFFAEGCVMLWNSRPRTGCRVLCGGCAMEANVYPIDKLEPQS